MIEQPNHTKQILIFSLAYFPYVGGAEVAIKEITDRIHDIEFHLITMGFSPVDIREEKIGNVLVHRVGGSSSYFSKILFVPRAALAALALHKKNHFSGIWAMMSYMVLPVVCMRFSGVKLPYVLNLQDGDAFSHVFDRWYVLPLRPLLRYGFRNATVVQPLSNYLAEWARRLGYQGTIEIIPNGVDVAHFSQTYPASVRNRIADSLGKKMGDVFLVTTSRLVRKNAIDDVICALKFLPEHVHFIIFGTGPQERQLKELARSSGVVDRVQCKGYIPHDDLPQYLQVCDIFVRPSITEGMGASFVEAMAAGLPIVATQEGGIADFLFDEKRNPHKPVTGWAVDTHSPEQIARAVLDIMAHQEKMRAVVATSKQMVAEKYDWNIIVHRMRERVFSKLV